MFIKNFVSFNVLLGISILLFSCGTGNQQAETDSSSADTADVMEEEESGISYILPSPLQIASIFKKSKLKYYEGLTSQQKDPAKYNSNLSKAANLGVYNADIAYCVLNKQTQEALNYMKAARQLSDRLGMSSVSDAESFGKRFEKNIGNEDSLISLIADLQMKTDIYLEENEMQHIAAITFAGAWIESMYIGTKVFEKDKISSANIKIVEQIAILEKIITVLKSFENKDSAISSLVAELTSILDLYNTFPSVVNSKNQPEEEESEIKLSDENVKAFSEKIASIRTGIING